jgi:Flp pilus assembly secretin CpaC
LPTHEQHKLFALRAVAVANTHAIGVETTVLTMLKKRLLVIPNHLTSNNIYVYSPNGRSVSVIPATVENPIDVAIQMDGQGIRCMR